MKKILRNTLYTAILAVLTIVIVYAQNKKNGARQANMNDRYLQLARAYLTASPGLKYDYSYNLLQNGTAIDSMIGKMQKWENDYADSNNYYTKILSGSFFVCLNHKDKQAQYLSIADLEKQLGASRGQMFNEVIAIPDSSFYTLGDVSVHKRDEDKIELIYILKDSTQSTQQMSMILDEKNQSVERITINFRIQESSPWTDMSGQPEPQRTAVLTIQHIQQVQQLSATASLSQLYYVVKENDIVLNQPFRGYKLSKL